MSVTKIDLIIVDVGNHVLLCNLDLSYPVKIIHIGSLFTHKIKT
jgi:hypothetical protein